MKSELQLLKYDYFERYKKELKVDLEKSFSEIEENRDPIGGFNFYLASDNFENRSAYYDNLRLGGNYYVINYALSIPFLLMLPQSLAK
ncbi:MAG: hypothetical protein M3R17_08085 [Bacteroidota bacterium]|nr:hypothetical protein [Bacteroidota bacterium]